MLLARLIGEGEPDAGAQTSAGASDESGLTAPEAAGPLEAECVTPAAEAPEVPAAGEGGLLRPAETAGDLSAAALLDRLMGAGDSESATEMAHVVPDEPRILALDPGAGAEPPVLADSEPGIAVAQAGEEAAATPLAENLSRLQEGGQPAGGGVAGWNQPAEAGLAQAGGWEAALPADVPGQDEMAAAVAASNPEEVLEKAAEEAGAGPEPVAAGAAEEGIDTEALKPQEVSAIPAVSEDRGVRPAERPPVVSTGDEDEFELVDAAQAEKMLDRLLDAARSAIRSTQASAPEAAAPQAVRAPDLAEAPPAALTVPSGIRPPQETEEIREPEGSASAQQAAASVAVPRTPSGEPGVREPSPRRIAEERAGEVSPIPPAAALMALGLPERLRARLESLGDVEQILQGQRALEPAPERKPRLLVFRAGGESYALSMECVREVERVSRVAPVPGAPEFIRGLVNLRGEILPLLDLAALFGRKGEPPAPRLIVAQASSADPVVALMVEELNGLAPFHEDGVEPPPQPGRMRGSLEHRGRRVWWIDPVAVFGAEALEKAAGEGQPGGLEENA